MFNWKFWKKKKPESRTIEICLVEVQRINKENEAQKVANTQCKKGKCVKKKSTSKAKKK